MVLPPHCWVVKVLLHTIQLTTTVHLFVKFENPLGLHALACTMCLMCLSAKHKKNRKSCNPCTAVCDYLLLMVPLCKTVSHCSNANGGFQCLQQRQAVLAGTGSQFVPAVGAQQEPEGGQMTC